MIVLLAPLPAGAQITGSNLFIGQAGNWPPSYTGRGPSNRQSFYDQANLQFVHGPAIAGVRFETDRNSEEENEYEGFTQRYLDLSDHGYNLRVGNFYTILGRGLVHRSFELTGVVLEKTGIRTRYAPSRDVDGVLVQAERGPLSLRFFSGSASEGTLSLAEERLLDQPRHRGSISGGQAAVTVYRDAKVGAAYSRIGFGRGPGQSLQQEVGSGFLELDPARLFGIDAPALPLYVEYAQLDRTFSEWWKFDTDSVAAHALYTSANLLWGPVDLSAEWKDYSQFRIGTNDPPSLVREHSFKLLNRSTHVLDAQREKGYQVELSYTPLSWTSLILNLTRADGQRDDRFEERYAELHVMPKEGERWEGTVFYGQGVDSQLAITRRDTYGALATVRFSGPYSATLDVQRQTAERVGFDFSTFSVVLDEFENVFVSVTGSIADRGSLSMVWERTTDELDPSWEFGRTKPLHLLSWTLSASIAEHGAALTVGKRRGGLACTAGTCYEVLPFEGVELRVLTRF